MRPIVILDKAFPRLREDGGFSGRRHRENVKLMELLEPSAALCPLSDSLSVSDHEASVAELEKRHPSLGSGRFFYERLPTEYHGGFAYSVFPGPTLKYLPKIEEFKLPFVCTVYPGGGFVMWGSRQEIGLNRLKKLAKHSLFRGFITHHNIIADYISKELPTAPVFRFYGGFSQIGAADALPPTFYGYDRREFNVCFVANRYDPLGLGKGFDIFLDVARMASRSIEHARFHVVGNWPNDETAGVRPDDPINFHGYLSFEALRDFYSRMDVIVSPTRIDVPVEGKFDGFPLAVDAAVCGVALCVTDPVGQNRDYVNGSDCWIVEGDPEEIANVLEGAVNDPEGLKRLALNGMRITRKLRDFESKMSEKAELLQTLAQDE